MIDMNCGKLKKNAFRVTKNRGVTSARVRVPGGHLRADVLGKVQESLNLRQWGSPFDHPPGL